MELVFFQSIGTNDYDWLRDTTVSITYLFIWVFSIIHLSFSNHDLWKRFTNASCETTSRWCGIEHWITLLCLYIGAVFYSLLISSISSILQTANLASRQFEEKLQQIDDYMRNKKLPAAMREKVKDCFYLQHSNGKLYEESEILDMLTPLLRREIKLFNGLFQKHF